jgi:hypothetical protein
MMRRSLLCAALVAAFGPVRADDLILQRVLVEGARASQLGIADSASAGSISARELNSRIIYRPGELLEAAPGIIVSQHSGEGKANQFYLRGFNLDHGTDLRTTLDDMPVNQRSHAHGQGWTDLNFLIPELVARLDYGKGPYSAQAGDFASAGSAALVYANRLPQSVASATVGQGGFARAVVAGSPDFADGSLLYALEATHNDGPFTNPGDYRKLNAVLRYSLGYANNGLSVTAMAYRGKWNSTDQIPRRAVDDGTLGRFDAIDPTDGGDARRYSLSGVWRRTGTDAADKVSVYVIRNQLDLFSNFTYFLNDPVNGDQFAQPDRRVTTGLNASRSWHFHGTANHLLTVGLQAQNDNIINGLYLTRARTTLETVRADHIVEGSTGLFVEEHAYWNDWLCTVAGLRGDSYRFQVGGEARRSRQLSPSAGLALGPWRATELYFNAGSGFHSNDARGVLAGADGLVRSQGYEVGVRSEAIPKLQLALSLYRLDFASELTYVGDEGTTEAGAPSRRNGAEFSAYYKPQRWLSVDFDAAYARARSRIDGPAWIPGAIEGVAQLALTVDAVGPWSGALRLRYFGPRPLTEDNSVRSHQSVTLNGRIGYRIDKRTRIEIEGFNLTNRRDSAIDYYYESRLKDEAAAHGDVHFHPIESRSLRATIVHQF